MAFDPRTWELLTHREKQEKHITMKIIYKLPILQPGILAHSFNYSVGMQKLMKLQGFIASPGLYSDFQARRVT